MGSLKQMGKQVEYSRCGIGYDNKGAVSAFQIGSSVVLRTTRMRDRILISPERTGIRVVGILDTERGKCSSGCG